MSFPQTLDQKKQDLLALFPFFQSLSQKFQQQMIRNAEFVSLPKGAFYFEEGQSCSRIALVGQGDIRVFKRGESGREITLYHVEHGQTCILTASCVLGKTPYPATAIVDKAAEAVVFSADIFRDWVAENEIIRQFVFSALANGMEGVLSLIEESTFRKLDERLKLFLRDKLKHDPASIEIKMTHEEVAVELGSAREVISRLLKDFERQGLIRQHRGLIIPIDPALLS